MQVSLPHERLAIECKSIAHFVSTKNTQRPCECNTGPLDINSRHSLLSFASEFASPLAFPFLMSSSTRRHSKLSGWHARYEVLLSEYGEELLQIQESPIIETWRCQLDVLMDEMQVDGKVIEVKLSEGSRFKSSNTVVLTIQQACDKYFDMLARRYHSRARCSNITCVPNGFECFCLLTSAQSKGRQGCNSKTAPPRSGPPARCFGGTSLSAGLAFRIC